MCPPRKISTPRTWILPGLLGILMLWICGPHPAARAQADIDLTGYTQTFDDEFNTLSVTTSSPKGASTWYYLPPYGSAGYYSESTWTTAAFSVSSGTLSNTASESGSNWYSGNLSSMDHTAAGFAQEYGYFEIRAQMPSSGTGAWPAFWIMSKNSILNNLNGTSLPNEEIDVFEWYGTCYTNNQSVIQEASHNWTPTGGPAGLYSPSTPMPGGAYPWQGFHVYGLQVDPVHVTWYIDGVETNQIATPTAYITSPFYMMIDYALGGGWPLTGMVNPSSLLVDWCRVYSLPDPMIATQPATEHVVVGQAATFSIAAVGTAPLTYQWEKNGTAISGGTNATYTTPAAAAGDNGAAYSCIVTSASGSVTSASATLLVNIGSIAVQFVGSGTALSGTASAGAPAAAQTNWKPVTGSTFSNIALTDNTGAATTARLTGTADGTYSCGSNFASGSGDATLCSGELFCGSFQTENHFTTFSGIPYAHYDVYAYGECDASSRGATYALTPSGGATQTYSFLCTNSASAWVQGTNTWNGSGAAPSLPVANYVHYSNLTASSFNLKFGSDSSNTTLNGVQIVNDGLPPVITGSLTATATEGSLLTYQISASNYPTSYSTTNLPSWLSLNAQTGLISGTATASGSTSVTITGSNAAGTGSAVLTIIAETRYAAWQNQVFTPLELADPAISGDAASPAGDGIANVIKYVLGLSPWTNDIGQMPAGAIAATGSGSYLRLTYNQLLSATDVTCTVQVSTDLRNWYSGPGFTALLSATNNPGNLTEGVTYQAIAPVSGTTPRQFIRLQVTDP